VARVTVTASGDNTPTSPPPTTDNSGGGGNIGTGLIVLALLLSAYRLSRRRLASGT
jgi:hypothetical protein